MVHKRKQYSRDAEVDMTPMIDMTFQLIAFFMFVLNFSGVEQNELIQLPTSELAQPPDSPLKKSITLQMTERGTVLYAGEELSLAQLDSRLVGELQVIRALNGNPDDTTIIIRGDGSVEAGRIQELMAMCQKNQFVKFALRARQDDSAPTVSQL